MKKIIKFILIVAVLTTFGIVVVKDKKITSPNTVRAYGDLTVTYLGVPLGAPIFSIVNMLPGDTPTERNIDVVNGGTVSRLVAVKGIRTGPPEQTEPKLENILDLVITEGTNKLYGTGSPTGPKTLKQFFDDSNSTDGVILNIVNSGQAKIYKFKVSFPSSAGNEYQNKGVIFDLTFGTVAANHIVINEVFYKVDSAHGIDSWKDRGSPRNDKKKGNDDEWIELYNPTGNDINLKNWTIEDNQSGKKTKVIIHENVTLKAGKFALVAKDNSMWKYWDEDRDAVKIQSTDFLGDGLDNAGDHLVLTNSAGAEVDFVRWGNDTFTTGHWSSGSNPFSSAGKSIERIVPGYDFDTPSDWISDKAPTPGN